MLVDADALARQVVEPGTAGLQRVVAEFGEGVLDAAGRLDRPKLASLVFGDPVRLQVLNTIVHPLVRSRAAALVSAAAEDAVVVQDIPLLVETGQGSGFHLVVVVDAPDDVRLQRMMEYRGMTADAARSRMAAQATRRDRLAAADAVLDNSGTLEQLLAAVDSLWDGRIVGFAENLAAGLPAARSDAPVLVPAEPGWAQQARRLINRIHAALPADHRDAVRLDHIGSTAVPGMDAADVIDLQLTVPDLGMVDSLAPALSAAGFPAVPGITADYPETHRPGPGDWSKRLHANADPERAVDLHVREARSPGWRFALGLRDWLRAEPEPAAEFLAMKRNQCQDRAGNPSLENYAAAKAEWFAAAQEPLEHWVQDTGWDVPPSGQ